MRRFSVPNVIGSLVVGMLVLATAGIAQAQQGRIVGQVLEETTGRPIDGARVFVVGTEQAAVTDLQGRYQLTNVAPGQVQLRVARLGYQSQLQTVAVPPGQTATADFRLATAVVTLDEVLVTATGEQRKREIANNIARINASELTQTEAITNFTDLLNSRASGVSVTQGSGTTGAATRIRIRGANSLSLTNDPLIYIDGVRVDNDQSTLTVGVGGQNVSAINYINPEEIESIEIIKGPAAATLYGTEAAAGVIRITTKRGSAGPARWNLWAEAGAVSDFNDYPSNFRAETASGGFCPNFFVAIGACTQSQVVSFNPLEDGETTPIGTGNRQQYGASVSGGTNTVNYFFSGEWERELGALRLPDSTEVRLRGERTDLPDNLVRPNLLERVSVRANIGAQVLENANVQASIGYISSDLRLPQNDNNVLGLLPSAFLGGATPQSAWGFFRPDEVFAINTRSDVDRFTGSLQGNWDPQRWLAVRAAAGVDLTDQFDNNFFPPGEVPFGTAIDGTRNSNRINTFQWTFDLGATATGRINDQIVSRTSVGAQFFKNKAEGTLANGNRIPKGTSSVGSAVITNASEFTAVNTTIGAFVEQQFAISDRLFISGGLRVDDNNNLGEQSDVVAYPRASVSWVISEEGFFPTGSFLNSLRLRGAWGQTGVQPATNAAIPFFNPVAVTQGDQDVVGVTVGNLGNPDLEPERSEEFEFGFDAEFLNGRVGLDATYFFKTTDDQIVSRTLPGSLGSVTSQFLNLAEVENKGFEGSLTAQIFQSRKVAWDITFNGSYIDNEVIDLGEDVQPIIFGLGGNTQRHQAGFAAGSYFQIPLQSFEDANGDGLIAPSEVVLGDTAEFIGQPLPKRELSVQTAVTLWNRLRISGLLDHRGGHKLDNATAEFRCAQFFNCQSSNVPGVNLEQQAATTADRLVGTEAGFIENASFWKLRELSFTFFAPDSWARRVLGAQRINLTVTGRNLFTITDYSGLDPEVITSAGANFSTADFLTLPPQTIWSARLNVSF